MEPHKEDVSTGIKLLAILAIVMLTLAITLAHSDNNRPVIDRREYIDAQY